MKDKGIKAVITKVEKNEPHKIRIPGFLVEDEIGLGGVIKKVTTSLGIKPCGGCNRRAEFLNQWMVFYGKH